MTLMKKHFILIGFGDVGQSIAAVFEKAHASFVVIDKNEAKLKDRGFEYIAGDATDEELLKSAGIGNASTVIIMLNNDDDIIFMEERIRCAPFGHLVEIDGNCLDRPSGVLAQDGDAV